MHRLPAILALLLSLGLSVQAQWEFLERIMFDLETGGNGLGVGVFGIGDINNDGYDDIAVGYFEKTAIYYGGDPMNGEPDIFLPGGYPTSYGDVNGDSISDFVVFHDTFASVEDSVYIYYGGLNFDPLPDLVIPPDNSIQRHNHYAQHTNTSGDLNHDGFIDLITTDYTADVDDFFDGKGRVYLHWGGPEIDEIVDLTIDGDSSGMSLGWDIEVGDLNGDTYDDLIIKGNFQRDDPNFDYLDIYLGGSEQDFTDKDYRIFEKMDPGFSSLGVEFIVMDFNADNYDDIVSSNGYIFLGSAELDTIADYFLDKPFGDSWFSRNANAGDINGDGYNDLAIGLPHWGLGSGYAFFYLGGPHPNTSETPDAAATPIFSAAFGRFLGAAGDVNNDGINDVVISEPTSDGASALNVFSGDTTLKAPTTAISGSDIAIPAAFSLDAYPNPFNNSVTLRFNLPDPGRVSLNIYNLLGQRITTLTHKRYPAGSHRITWHAGEQTDSGIYIAHIESRNYRRSIKILLIQ